MKKVISLLLTFMFIGCSNHNQYFESIYVEDCIKTNYLSINNVNGCITSWQCVEDNYTTKYFIDTEWSMRDNSGSLLPNSNFYTTIKQTDKKCKETYEEVN